jgi:hypothetical protein
MTHRRTGRDPDFARLKPAVRAELLGDMKAPRWLIARALRDPGDAAARALLDPRRRAPKAPPPEACARKTPR